MQQDQKNYPNLSFDRPPHVMVAEARYYTDVADMQFEGVRAVLEANGATYERFTVPGALELPAAVEMGVRSGKFDAYVALGCVIRGETSHYDTVAGESARGLMDLSVRDALPLGNGILTVESKAQALARANPADQDKGGGAAYAALQMLFLSQQLKRAA